MWKYKNYIFGLIFFIPFFIAKASNCFNSSSVLTKEYDNCALLVSASSLLRLKYSSKSALDSNINSTV